MKPKFFLLLMLAVSCVLLTGCVAKSPSSETETPGQTSTTDEGLPQQSTGNQEKSVILDQTLTSVGNAAGLSNPMKMRVRRKVDDVYLNDEGQGFTVRSTAGDQKFTQQAEVVGQTLKSLGFSINEYTPKNPESLVAKFIKYKKESLECTFEIRNIGTTGESELAFGCL